MFSFIPTAVVKLRICFVIKFTRIQLEIPRRLPKNVYANLIAPYLYFSLQLDIRTVFIIQPTSH